ncbi:MAG: hypothetical protein U0869_06030 [Chloroflexota bacterium]
MSPLALPVQPDADLAVTLLARLLESELGTLDALALTLRAGEGSRSMDGLTALARLLGEARADDPVPPLDPAVAAIHAALLAASPEHSTAISGTALHLRDLLAEGMDLPDPTSMMRKRGVTRLADHLVDPAALAPEALAATVQAAAERCLAAGMKHTLIVVRDGTVHASGRAPDETMAHWSNVEFSAKVAVLRVEERLVASLAE